MKIDEFPEFLTLEEVGELLRLPRKTLLHHIRKGRINAVKISGRHKLVPKWEIQRILGK